MTLPTFSDNLLPLVEKAMAEALTPASRSETRELHSMMAYQLGWTGKDAGPKAQGKRIRPLLVLLTYGALAPDPTNWARAVPAAAAVELLHNFSLIHDDIQDNSPLRRGRPTVWKKWGIAQAINAGDAMFTAAFLALARLRDHLPADLCLDAQELFAHTCLALTRGQYLDLSFETRERVSLEEYNLMIGGKTAALLATCSELGALAAEASEQVRRSCRAFGRFLGLAFQAQDDLLGIWGDESRTGKSAVSDLLAGKQSLPVVYGLSYSDEFSRKWRGGPVEEAEARELARILEAAGARDYVEAQAGEFTVQALAQLDQLNPQGEPGKLLRTLAQQLLNRQL